MAGSMFTLIREAEAIFIVMFNSVQVILEIFERCDIRSILYLSVRPAYKED
jgi:hypothetical protein